ncbi:MAG: hypothetical protein V1789_00525 [PVC group bacterium]
MKDRFDEMMEKFLVPMDLFEGPVMDSAYFMRKDGSFVFSEGYCHPPGSFWGMIIKYPLEGGHIDIFGRAFGWTHRTFINGELTMVPFAQQVENQFKVAPELRDRPGVKPIFAKYFVRFPLSDCSGYFDAHHSMEIHCREHEWIDTAVKKTCRLLGWDPQRTGVTGSLAYGLVEDDIDLVFIGSPEENAAVARGIRRYLAANPEARVVELGKEWPIRFYYEGTLICPFFRYDDVSQIPLLRCEMTVVEDNVPLEAVVGEDTHTLYLPAIVGLRQIERADGRTEDDLELIVYNGALRGELWEGDRVRLRAPLVNLAIPGRETRRAVLVTDHEQVEKIN